MMNIFTNVGRAPVDAADAQSRLASNSDASSSDSDGSGFDEVFSQVNRGSASVGGGGVADSPMPPSATKATQPNQAVDVTTHGLAALLQRVKTGTSNSAGALSVDGSAKADVVVTATTDSGDSTGVAAAGSKALDAVVTLSVSPSANGQAVANAAVSMPASATWVDLVEAVPKDAKVQPTDADPTSVLAPASKRPKPVDPANVAAAPTLDATDAILAALLFAQAPAPASAPAPAGANTPAPAANGKKAAEVAATTAEDEAVSDLPDTIGEVAPPTGRSSLEPPAVASLDAQVALRPAEGDRTLVSVLAQATHFPIVERLSVSQQLATPIAEAAKGIADAPPTAATAPMRTLDVTLSPGDLGSVTISMRIIGGSLHLGVEAQDAGTARLIERDKATLASALHASGYSVADLTIVHGAEAGGQTQSDGNNASQDQRSAFDGDTSGSNTSGGGAERGDQALSRKQASPGQSQPNGDSGSGTPVRAERGVYV